MRKYLIIFLCFLLSFIIFALDKFIELLRFINSINETYEKKKFIDKKNKKQMS